MESEYAPKCLSVSEGGFWDLTDVTLADEDIKSILTDIADRAIQGKHKKQVWPWFLTDIFLLWFLAILFSIFCGGFLWWWGIMQLQREWLWRGEGGAAHLWQPPAPCTSHQCHQPGRNCHQPTSHNTAAREKTTKATQILAGFSDPSLFGWCPCLNCLWLPFQIAFDPYRAFYPESPWLPATIRLSFSTVIIESEPLLQTKVNETAAENWQT